MLTIRAEQLAVLGRLQERLFVERMAVRLADQFPAVTAGLNRVDLLARVTTAIQSARQFGLTTERDISVFLQACGAYGWDFLAQNNDWAQTILTRPSLGRPSARLRWLVRTLDHRAVVAAKNESLRREFLG